MKKVKLAVGFLCYGEATAKYLPQFVPSLMEALKEAGAESLVLAWDNNPKLADNFEFLDKHYPQVQVIKSGVNLGFGKSYNRLIAEAKAWGADYFLAVNPDTFLGRHSVAKLLAGLELDERLGSVAPKVYFWDYAHGQGTKIIDTCGIVKDPGLRFHDLGQGQVDHNQFDSLRIIGPSGCAALYRMDALDNIRQAGEYFDELMFMYKEDCDLAVRLRLAGWGSELVPEAHVWHDRTVVGQGSDLRGLWSAWHGKSRQAQLWAFHNQLILYYKYWRWESWSGLAMLWVHLSMRLGYACLFDRELWQEIKEFWRLRQRIHRVPYK